MNLVKLMRIKEGSSRPGEWGQPRIPRHALQCGLSCIFIPIYLEAGAERRSGCLGVGDGAGTGAGAGAAVGVSRRRKDKATAGVRSKPRTACAHTLQLYQKGIQTGSPDNVPAPFPSRK